MEKIYQVKVFGLSGEMKMIDLCSTEEEMKRFTVRQLREKILQKFGIKLGSGKSRFKSKLNYCTGVTETTGDNIPAP